MIARKIAMMIKNSNELNGSIIKTADKQNEWPIELHYSGDGSLVNTSNIKKQQCLCTWLYL